MDLPRLLVHAGRLGDGVAGTGGDDPAALHLAALERRRGKVEADVGALFALLRGDQDAVAHHDQPFGGLVRHGGMCMRAVAAAQDALGA